MPRNFTYILPATAFVGDNDAQLVAGDGSAAFVNHKGRPALAFDDTDEEAATSVEFEVSEDYTGLGTLKAKILFAMASDVTNDIAIDVFVESKTPNSDTLDMETATSWDSANSGTASVSGTTAGDPLTLVIILSNKDSIAAGDFVRIGIRRDTDSANDDATGDMFIYSVSIYEE